jgi:hypothetical protein
VLQVTTEGLQSVLEARNALQDAEQLLQPVAQDTTTRDDEFKVLIATTVVSCMLRCIRVLAYTVIHMGFILPAIWCHTTASTHTACIVVYDIHNAGGSIGKISRQKDRFTKRTSAT